MNKHIETIIAFGVGTADHFKEMWSELRDGLDDLKNAFKKIGHVLYLLVWWFLTLLLMLCLPLATRFRLKAEKEYEEAVEKAKREYMERMTCLHKERGGSDEN